MNGKSREAVVTKARLDKLLLSVNEAYASLPERKQQFTAEDIKNRLQGSVATQMTLLKRLDLYIDDLKSRIGVDVAVGTVPAPKALSREDFERIRDVEISPRRRFYFSGLWNVTAFCTILTAANGLGTIRLWL